MVLFFAMNSSDKKYVHCKAVSDCFISVKCAY